MSYSVSVSKAILVVIFISDKIRQRMFEFLSAQMISKVLNIPKPTLVKILRNLTHAGIIETKEGKNGGIRIAKPIGKITVLDVFEAMEQEKPLFQTAFNIAAEGKRPSNAQKSVATLLEASEKQMKLALARKTIEDILKEMDG